MFGLFKKKDEKPEEQKLEQNTENKQYKEFAAQFQPEELSVLAVTGANGFGGGRGGKETLWTASVGLTAWMEEDSPDIHRGEFLLTTIADDKLLGALRQRVPRDFIIKFKGRLSEDGGRILLTSLPEPGFDPDLKAILEEQKKPVTFWEEGLGTFTLNRQVDWFETDIDWLGATVTLSFDREEEEKMRQSQATARTLLAGAEEWDRRVREYAGEELLDLFEEEGLSMDQMELEAIQADCWGGYGFWFSDSEGRSVHVTGDLENGPHDADLEG